MDIALGRREVASILFKHSKLLIGIFLGVFFLCFLGSFLIVPTYKAESRILVQSGREFEVATDKGSNAPTGVPYITKQEVINSEVEILTSPDIAESVIKAIGLARIYPKLAEDGLLVRLHIIDPYSDAERLNLAAKKFEKKLKIEVVTMSNIVKLSYWNQDRDVAIDALQQLTKIYQQKHAEIFSNRRSGVLGEQTRNYESELEDVTQKIGRLKETQHLSDIVYEREQLIQDRSDVEAKLRELKVQSIEAHRTLAYYQQQLRSMPELVLTNENAADSIETAKSRLMDLNAQLLQLKQRYADGNPASEGPIKDLEVQMQQVKAFIDDPSVNKQKAFGRNITFDDGRLKLQNAEAAVPAVDQKIEFETTEESKIISRLQDLDQGEASLEVMTREQNSLRELLHDYRDRYEEAKMSGDMDKQNLISVSIVHAPEADQQTDKPRHLLFAAAGFVLGIMAMAVAILYFLVFRDSIITTESLERILHLRVLGAIPDLA